jgi:hypothetical protein
MILSLDGTFTWTDAEKAAILEQSAISSPPAGQLYEATCDLIVAAIDPTGSTQFGNLTLPAWTGYAAQTITWTAAQITLLDLAELDGESVEFALPANAVGQTIYGWAVSDTTPILAGVFVLNTPVGIQDTGTCVVTPYLPWQT